MKEFVKLDNKLILKLKITPLSPLMMKLGRETDTALSYIMTNKSSSKTKIKNEGSKITEDERKGEPIILGSTLKGLFRARFLYMFDDKNYNDNLFGYVQGDDSKKSKFFISDAFLYDNDIRKTFLNDFTFARDKYIKRRSITPIDSFSKKVKAPLTNEYIEKDFLTEIIINRFTPMDLKGIFFIIRDSQNKEIAIGNSKNRGFGDIKFEVEKLIIENYKNSNDIMPNMNKYFEIDKKKSLLLGGTYLKKVWVLKNDKLDDFLNDLDEVSF